MRPDLTAPPLAWFVIDVSRAADGSAVVLRAYRFPLAAVIWYCEEFGGAKDRPGPSDLSRVERAVWKMQGSPRTPHHHGEQAEDAITLRGFGLTEAGGRCAFCNLGAFEGIPSSRLCPACDVCEECGPCGCPPEEP